MDDNQVVATIYPANLELVRRAVQVCKDNGATEPDSQLLGELLAIGANQVIAMMRRAGNLPGVPH